MTITKCVNGSKFRLQSGGENEITVPSSIDNTDMIEACTATIILDKLHKDFTEQYTTSATLANIQDKPSFYLRNQPTFPSFNNETANNTINRFYKYFTENKVEDQVYLSAIHAIMRGVYNTGVTSANYMNAPDTQQGDFNSPDTFKGIYGLINVNNILEKRINDKIKSLSTTSDGSSIMTNHEKDYEQRQGIKTTLEEIARRENEIYREKFFNIILIIVGIFIVGSQLVQKYFSFGGGGSSGTSGFGFGNLFTGFGLGASSGLFSRFGGLGLGRSGRSRVTGIFSSSPYSLSNR
jgi:hypothetical protein